MRSAADRGAPLAAPPASITRRVLALAYEALLLLALLLVGSLPFVMIMHEADGITARPLFQIYLLAVAAAYFIRQWRRGGQTLAMKTWRIRLVDITPGKAILRFLYALVLVPTGISVVYALFDRDRQFLHDRLAGSRLISVDKEDRNFASCS